MATWLVTDPIDGDQSWVESTIEPPSIELRDWAIAKTPANTNVLCVRGKKLNRFNRPTWSLVAGEGTHAHPYRGLASGDDLQTLLRLAQHYNWNISWR